MKCPKPIVEMAKMTRKMEDGEVLEIHADDPVAENDIPAWCQTTGNELLKMEDAGGFKKYFVRKVAKL